MDATNRARASAGLPPLAARPELTRLAQDWAQTMSQRNQLVHRPDLREHATAEYAVSENILMTRGRATSAEDMVRMWMNSPGHRANILDRNARWIGVGIAESANGTTYAVQNFGVARR
ncbi:CAP domain-containing protein [Corynebacterium suedekumii]|nr:CAP domain-containing protein [Corynebacterium suedekumii]